MMKGYKKVMDFIAGLEKWILVLSTVLILILTVGNVLSRKLLHRSWSFTEELVVAVFVLITLVAGLPRRRTGKSASAYRPVTKEKQKTSCCDDYRAVCGIYSGAVSVWFG